MASVTRRPGGSLPIMSGCRTLLPKYVGRFQGKRPSPSDVRAYFTNEGPNALTPFDRHPKDALIRFHGGLNLSGAHGEKAHALVATYGTLIRKPREELTDFDTLRPYTDALLAALLDAGERSAMTADVVPRGLLTDGSRNVATLEAGDAVLQGGLAAGAAEPREANVAAPATSPQGPATAFPFEIAIEGVPITDLIPVPAAERERPPTMPPLDIGIAGEDVPAEAVGRDAGLPGVTRLYRRLSELEAITPIELTQARHNTRDQLAFLQQRRPDPFTQAEADELASVVEALLAGTYERATPEATAKLGPITPALRYCVILELAAGASTAQAWLTENYDLVTQKLTIVEPIRVARALHHIAEALEGTTIQFTVPGLNPGDPAEQIDLSLDAETRAWITAVLHDAIEGRLERLPRALRTKIIDTLTHGPNHARGYITALLRANFLESRLCDPEEVAIPAPARTALRGVEVASERPAVPGTRVSTHSGTVDDAEDVWARLDTAWKTLGAYRMTRPELWKDLAADAQLIGIFGTTYATVVVDGESFANTPVDGLGRLMQQYSELQTAHGMLDEPKDLNRWLRNAIAEGIFPVMAKRYLREQGAVVTNVMQTLWLALERVRERHDGTLMLRYTTPEERAKLEIQGKKVPPDVPYPPLPAVTDEQVAAARDLVTGAIARLTELGGTEMAGRLQTLFDVLVDDDPRILVHFVSTQREALTQRVYSVLGGQSPQALRKLFAVYCEQVRARVEYLSAIFAGTVQLLGDGSEPTHVLPVLHRLPSLARLEADYPLSGPTPDASFQALVLRAGLPAAGMGVFGFLDGESPADWYLRQSTAEQGKKTREREFSTRLLFARADMRNRVRDLVAQRRAEKIAELIREAREQARRLTREDAERLVPPDFGQFTDKELAALEAQDRAVEDALREEFGMARKQLPARTATREEAGEELPKLVGV